ncbi:hypothetical protein [Aegicerativicinus sediminis]
MVLVGHNEAKKRKLLETATLIEIRSNLTQNVLHLEEYAASSINVNTAITKILGFWEEKIPYSPDMDTLFSLFHVYNNISFERNAYENLKVVDANLISNNNLKKNISDIFEIELTQYDPYTQARNDRYNISVVLPIQNKYFSRKWKGQSLNTDLHPSNYDVMMNDIQFYNMCTELAYRRKQAANNFIKSATKLKQLIAKIDQEIHNNP